MIERELIVLAAVGLVLAYLACACWAAEGEQAVPRDQAKPTSTPAGSTSSTPAGSGSNAPASVPASNAAASTPAGVPASGPASMPASAATVRPAAVAGSWYPDDPAALRKQLQGYLDAAKAVELPGEPLVLVAPHAGYQFSGPMAATAFKTVAGKSYSRVIVIGPSHRFGFAGAVLPTMAFFETPLGRLPIDQEFCRKLAGLKGDIDGSAGFRFDDKPHGPEHCLEMELPLLQMTVSQPRIVPILVGVQCDAKMLAAMGKALAGLIDEKTLIVASSDFVHYGPNYDWTPFKDNIPEMLQRYDNAAAERVLAADALGFHDFVTTTGATICGAKPIALALWAYADRSDLEGVLLGYDTSGHITNNYTNSVSYLSLAVCGQAAAPLNAAEQKTLLAIARDQVRQYLKDRKELSDVEKKYALTPRLKKLGPAFVTLKRGDELRGCIGHVAPIMPLWQSVASNAVNACGDSRFVGDPITLAEEPKLHVEISVLSRNRLVGSNDDIKIGRDGLILRTGRNSGLFLPQVPVEQKWDLTQYLVHLCAKAGVSADALKDSQTRIYKFTAQVFGETETTTAPAGR